MIRQFSLKLLLSAFVALGAVSCAPNVKDLNLSQEIVDDLPQDYALNFLQALSPASASTCRFEDGGLMRRLPQTGQVLPGKYPYPSFYAMPMTPGVMVVVVLYGPRSSQPWCVIRAESIADRQGEDVKRFTGKILTALLSMGVRLPTYVKAPVQARRPTTQAR